PRARSTHDCADSSDLHVVQYLCPGAGGLQLALLVSPPGARTGPPLAGAVLSPVPRRTPLGHRAGPRGSANDRPLPGTVPGRDSSASRPRRSPAECPVLSTHLLPG